MFAVWIGWNSMAGQTKDTGVFCKSMHLIVFLTRYFQLTYLKDTLSCCKWKKKLPSNCTEIFLPLCETFLIFIQNCQIILLTLLKKTNDFSQDLKDSINYGLYCPPMNGRAGKFLDEERLLREYPLQGPIGFLEVLSQHHWPYPCTGCMLWCIWRKLWSSNLMQGIGGWRGVNFIDWYDRWI